MSSGTVAASGEGEGEGPGVCPGLDKVIVTLRVVVGLTEVLTEEPSAGPGWDKVMVTSRVVVTLTGELMIWTIDVVLLCDASPCWTGLGGGPQNQPSAGATVDLSPESMAMMLR